jgi:oxygen-dependent protoporphyrinogen oxidase
LEDGPVFASVDGGLGSLPASVVDALGLTVRTGTSAVALRQSSQGQASRGWSIDTDDGQTLDADRVILAVPAFAAAPLLATVAPVASAAAARLEYASVALVTAVFDAGDVGAPLEGTGFLVPPVTGRLTKAATFVTRKWQWAQDAAPGRDVLRFSVGRQGDERGLDLPDGELAAAVLEEVRDVLRLRGGPRASAVTRWGQSLPQYRVGHRARVDAARAALPDSLALAGAAWDGVGIPACIASGRAAAGRVGGNDPTG